MTEPVWQRVLGHVEPDADLQSLLRVPDAPKPRMDSRVVWLVILVAGTVYELWAVGNRPHPRLHADRVLPLPRQIGAP